MTLSPAQAHILSHIGLGWTLKAHRDLEGAKIYQLHPLDDAAPQRVRPTVVQALVKAGYLPSSWKFPANTFYLTDKGRAAAEALLGHPIKPLGTQGYT